MTKTDAKLRGECYLVLEKPKRQNRLRVVKTTTVKPSLKAGQAAVKVSLRVPAKIFEAVTEVSIDLDESHLIRPAVEATPLPA